MVRSEDLNASGVAVAIYFARYLQGSQCADSADRMLAAGILALWGLLNDSEISATFHGGPHLLDEAARFREFVQSVRVELANLSADTGPQ